MLKILFMLGGNFGMREQLGPMSEKSWEDGVEGKRKIAKKLVLDNTKSEIDTMVKTENTEQALMGFRKVTVEFLKVLIHKGTERADTICTVCYVKDRGPPII